MVERELIKSGRGMPMPEPETRLENREAVLAHWQDRLQILTDEVKAWVEKAGWRTRTIEKPINDRKLGRHIVPVLLMERNTLEVALNPVSPLVPGAEGAVDLYLVPAYDDIASLYLENGQWVIHYTFPTDSGATHSLIETEGLPLSEETINRILDAIASHAA
jgi:hypothetical protein